MQDSMRHVLTLVAAVSLFASAARGTPFAASTGGDVVANRPGPGFAVEELAPGVYAFVRTKPPGLLLDSNVLVVVSDEDVLVVDANLTPTSAEASIAAIRKLTPKPVRTLVNTHRHADHVTGNAVYQREFPGVEIVGHEAMKEDLAAHGAETLRGWIGWAREIVVEFPRALDAGLTLESTPLSKEERESYAADLAAARELAADAERMQVVLPTRTVRDRMVLERGARTIEIVHLGKGHTRGDLAVWLPRERIVAAGDLVVAPVPLVGPDQAFVSEWSETLGVLSALKPSIVVPGHGPVLRGTSHVALYKDFLDAMADAARTAIARGDTAERAIASLDVAPLRDRMAGESRVLRSLFDRWGPAASIGAMYRVHAEARGAGSRPSDAARDERKSGGESALHDADGASDAHGASNSKAKSATSKLRFAVSDLKIGDGKLDRGWIGGVSLADVDGDGDLDLYCTRGFDVTDMDPAKLHPDRSMLYRNDGQGTFARVEDSALSNADHYASGATFGDVDQDGDLDAFVSTELGKSDVFYRNAGGGQFAREELGDATITAASNFSSTWADIDGDGDLDLYVGGPALEHSAPNLAYENDGGKFVRVRDSAIASSRTNSGAVLFADLDGDGGQDLFVANSDITRKSKVAPAEIEHPVAYRNEGAWQFTPIAPQPFDGADCAANVAALGDVDGDGDLDLYLGMYTLEGAAVSDRLFRNDGRGKFERIDGFPGTPHVELASGAAFADFDLDGDLDLVSANFGDGIRVFVNDGRGAFTLLQDEALLGRKTTHAGVATGDLDGDGDPDVVIGNWGETSTGEYATVMRNDGAHGDWTELVLRDRRGAANPPGARAVLVTRRADGSERRQLREAAAQTSFRSQSASPFLYALPEGETLVKVEVRWPDGTRESRDAVKRNARSEIARAR